MVFDGCCGCGLAAHEAANSSVLLEQTLHDWSSCSLKQHRQQQPMIGRMAVDVADVRTWDVV